MLVACSKEVNIDLPVPEERLVINAFFETGEKFNIYLGKSGCITEQDTGIIDNAQILLYADNVFQGIMQHTSGGFYTHDTVIIRPGVLYMISASAQGFPDIEAADIAPPPCICEDVLYDPDPYLDSEGDDYYKLRLSLYDNRRKDNFYELVLQSFIKEDKYRIVSINGSNEKVLINEGDAEFYSGFCVFSDVFLDSSPYTLNLQTYSRISGTKSILNVLTVSETYYRFRKSLIRHFNAQFPEILNLVESVTLYSNIDGGYGIFAGYSRNRIITDPE